jgi:hypothetical protein
MPPYYIFKLEAEPEAVRRCFIEPTEGVPAVGAVGVPALFVYFLVSPYLFFR